MKRAWVLLDCSSVFFGILALYFVITDRQSSLGAVFMGIMVFVHIIADSQIQKLKEAL